MRKVDKGQSFKCWAVAARRGEGHPLEGRDQLMRGDVLDSVLLIPCHFCLAQLTMTLETLKERINA